MSNLMTFFMLIIAFPLCMFSAGATTYYVDASRPDDSGDGLTWATAKQTIQAAADLAVDSDTVWVTNGVYNTGCRVTPGYSLSNRVVITQNITVQSVNGPDVTIIQGQGPMGSNAVRCVYMINGYLSGFMLTNGHTMMTEYVVQDSGDNSGGGCCMTNAVLHNCIVSGNAAPLGGGVSRGVVIGCNISGNSAVSFGGGAYRASLNNCVVSKNTCEYKGGGMFAGDANTSHIFGNSARMGAGVASSMLTNCLIIANLGIGVHGDLSFGYSHINNCILYHNKGANYSLATLNYCCTTPMPLSGSGNITNEPELADSVHLSSDSPCIGAAYSAYAAGVDIDGDAWADPPCIGCDQFVEGSGTGLLTVAIQTDYLSVREGYPICLYADIEGHASSNIWSFGDGTYETNIIYKQYVWSMAGSIDVEITAFNSDFPGGITATQRIEVLPSDMATSFVWTNSPSPTVPYTNWHTAAHTIQDAVEVVDPKLVGALIMVTNGTYALGGAKPVDYVVTNRVCLTNDYLILESVNGPSHTVIEGSPASNGECGDDAVRCVFIDAFGVIVNGFTITNGYTSAQGIDGGNTYGGGVFSGDSSSTISNCVIAGNVASREGGGVHNSIIFNCKILKNSSSHGAGINDCSAYNCSIVYNTAHFNGGGANGSELYGCTVMGNQAKYNYGGGVYGCSAYNSIVYDNHANQGDGNYYSASMFHSCTTPMPLRGDGHNITNNPKLADALHLSSDSSCINAGSSEYSAGCDIDGDIWGDPPSVGCDQFVAGTATGVLSVVIQTDYLRVREGCTVDLYADIEGHAVSNVWSLGDGTYETNVVYKQYAWMMPGTVDVEITAYNTDFPGGVTATQRIEIIPSDLVTCFVWTNSPLPSAPYTNWHTAAHTIQDAVEAVDPKLAGALIMVTNGVYDFGGIKTPGYSLTNRVCITNDYIILKSVNGPSYTVIEGSPSSGGGCGDDAVRCIFISALGVVVDGFSIMNGNTSKAGDTEYDRSGGGILSLSLSNYVSNCVISENASAYNGGGVCLGFLNNCIVSNNIAVGNGGAASKSKMNNCTVICNTSGGCGGGAFQSALNTCTIDCNISSSSGGGVFQSTLNNCIISGNKANGQGGGVFDSTLNNCIIANNAVTNSSRLGGGAYGGRLINCLIYGNTSLSAGGGIFNGTLLNCIITRNIAASYGGGSYGASLYNCISWDNISSLTAYSNYYSGTINCTCTAPLPSSGYENIVLNPLFVNPAQSNFHLQALSPCIDAGQYEEWMNDSTDLEGNSRIINGYVDMGAYEFHFDAGIRVMLQGPYSTNIHVMTTMLSNSIPLTSLYTSDPRTVTNIYDGVVDWVLLQMCPSSSNTPIFSRSCFLQSDGSMVSYSGDTNLLVEVDPGTTNYLVVAHRNHPAVMSAEPIVFTNQSISYDFTLSSNLCYGADSGAVELESGVWGLMAGDADGDGWISWVDRAICTTLFDHVGYQCGDYDLDGVVTTNDLVLCEANADRMAAFPNAEISFSPSLSISPARKTVVVEDSLTLVTSGSTNAITWFGVETGSGGEVSSLTSTTALYQAGSTSEVVDVIQAWDGDYRFGRSYMNIIDSSAGSSYGKAVVLAGRISPSDPLWEATDYLAGNAFNTLLYRGFSKDTVQYLSAVTNRDVDGDGMVNDIDLYASVENATKTFTNWVYDAEKLFVYFVDHGSVDGSGNAHLRLNPSEILAAAQLDSWLDTFQDTQNKEVTVLIDCCYAARFKEALSYTGTAKRVVIAASGTNEPAYYMANGLISFSDAFFSGIMSGNDLAKSYEDAADAMASYQEAGYDDNVGGGGAEGLYLGATFVAGKDVPHIGLVCGNQLLTESAEASLWVGDVVSAYALDRVWCVVIPPTHNPTNPAQAVIDIPEVDLSYNSESGRYEGDYTGFSEPGSYKIIYYARDIWNSVSAPMQSYVVQNGYDERFIIVGGGETNWGCWDAINNLANYTYGAMQQRGLDKDHLYYMSAWTNQDVDLDGSNDVNSVATLENLGNAITNWALGADMLSVYLIGAGSNDLYYLSELEPLEGTVLDALLDSLQLTNDYAVNVVMDFSASGSWIPLLKPPTDKKRICIASAAEEREAVMDANGMLSFTRFFVSDISAGESVGEAYRSAQYSMRRASGAQRQNARIDDNGNGIPNEKNVDGVVSASVYMGPAFVTGNELPSIGFVPVYRELTNTTSFNVWAADVTDADGITNVWCLVSPPSAGWDTNSIGVNLVWNSGNDRYEGEFTEVTSTGTYACTYFAQNTNGVISIPVQSMVQIMQDIVVGPDIYEPDDSSLEASVFTMGLTKEHTIHASNDVDWVFFTAYSNFLYDIETVHGTNQIDTVLTLYRRETNGLLTQIDTIDEFGYDQGEIMGLDHPALGLYYIKVHAADFIEAGSYSLTITPTPSGGISDKLIITVMNLLNGQPIPGGITAYLHMGSEQSLGANDQTIFYGLADGDYTVSLNNVPDGWPHRTMASEISVHIPKQAQSVLNADFYLFPSFYMVGACRDEMTKEWIGGADLIFTGMSHALQGQTMTSRVQSDGSLSETQLYNAVDWELTITHPGYSNETVYISGASVTAGSVSNVGNIYLNPEDLNGNGIADEWESLYFGAGSNVNAQEDRDGDGYDNYTEYRIGTDPTNCWSSLLLDEAVASTGGVFAMTWPVASGRKYSILRTPGLNPVTWSVVFGPQEATNQQSWMQWTDTESGSNHFYQIKCEY